MSEKLITISNVNEAYRFVSTCKPYKIRKAVLKTDTEEKEVYVVALRGTNSSFDKNDPLSIPVCFRSFASLDNIYVKLVRNAIFENVPAGSELVFLGHSLGGMVCQILGADEKIRRNYNLLSVLTMGSPYIVFKGNKCPLNRMADKADVIPALFSMALIFNSFIGNVHHESAGYYGKFIKAHCDSYESFDKWKKYDCLGIENGNHSVELTDSDEYIPVI